MPFPIRSLRFRPFSGRGPVRAGLTLALGAALLSGCTAAGSKRRADREVFGLLRSKSSKIPNSGEDLLSITPPEPVKLEELEKNMATEDFLGERAWVEESSRKLNLADCLLFAVTRNRTYLGEKELVYLNALDLTLKRQQFSPILDGGGSVEVANRSLETSVNQFVKESTLTTTGGASLTALQRTGTRIATDLTTDFLRFLTGDLRSLKDANITAGIAQPLLRGAGYLAASEVLTQGERDVLYAIRDFTQYRKEFAVDIANSYFRALQAREAARNAYLAYKAFSDSVEREAMLTDAGVRPTKSFFYQVRQAQLTAENRWRSAIRAYEQELDALKVDLGFPVEEPVILDTRDLDALEIIDPPGTLEEALTTALVTRLDVWNNRDEVEDAVRRVKIATQDLLPTLDAVLNYSASGRDFEGDRLRFDSRRRNVSLRFESDFNLNQKPVRNALRAAQIAEQRARRQLELVEERVREDIRRGWRDLELARQQYEIAEQALAISEERVKLERELLQEGQGTARDVVEAERDLIDARNGVIASRITHTISRLQLWRDMGVLFIQKDGTWAGVLKKEAPQGS
jgi:outer membrane protein TolC